MDNPLWLIVLLLVAFLLAMLAAPFVDRQGKTPEIGLTRGIAVVYLVITCATTLYRISEIAMAPALEIDMPVAEFWPELPASASVQGPTAQVVDGGFSNATVVVHGLAAGTRWLLGSSVLLQGMAMVFIGAAVISMCNGYLKQSTFRPSLVKWFSAAAVVIAVCGLGWQIVDGIAGYEASQQVLRVQSGQWDMAAEGREDLNEILGQLRPADFAVYVNFWPIWAGLGLFITAQLFRRGLALQKETTGLI